MIKICKNHIIFVNKNNKFHRKNEPAVIWSDGYKFWYQYGKLHRENGPAIINSDGDKSWYINNKQYTKRDYYIKLKKMDI